MAEYNVPCMICKHYDHLRHDSNMSLFGSMCWTGKMWDTKCTCKKYIDDNLEYLEWKYEQDKNI